MCSLEVEVSGVVQWYGLQRSWMFEEGEANESFESGTGRLGTSARDLMTSAITGSKGKSKCCLCPQEE